MSPILEINNIKTHFFTDAGVVHAVDGVSLSIAPQETLGLVGESGSGKSVTAMSVMRLIPQPPGRIVSGSIMFDGRDLCQMTENELCGIRGKDISMVFQEPMTSLNPVFTIGEQVAEPMRLHLGYNRKQALERSIELLKQVGISAAERVVRQYPHQLSGGMRQRVMIAMALGCHPKLLIADEPTTALDVTIQAQILELIKQLKAELGMAMLLITHDLGIVANVASRVAIMYAGKIVESAETGELFSHPLHPYTQGLLASIPDLTDSCPHKRLQAIPGTVPNLLSPPPGCRFQPRCDKAMEKCNQEPQLIETHGGHFVSCWNKS